MNGKFVLDTNVILDQLKGRAHIAAFFRDHRNAEFLVSQISRIELLSYHKITARAEQEIKGILDAMLVVNITSTIEDAAILFRRATRRKLPDSLVAATAISEDAALVTGDKDLANAAYPGFTVIVP